MSFLSNHTSSRVSYTEALIQLAKYFSSIVNLVTVTEDIIYYNSCIVVLYSVHLPGLLKLSIGYAHFLKL